MASLRCGQTALLTLPPGPDDKKKKRGKSNNTSATPSVAGYPLPASLQVERRSLTPGAQVGIEVLKLSKVSCTSSFLLVKKEMLVGCDSHSFIHSSVFLCLGENRLTHTKSNFNTHTRTQQ